MGQLHPHVVRLRWTRFSFHVSINNRRIPFYGYIRLLFLLYLILPQTQGARLIYEEKIHPFLEENETQIDEFISSAHDRLKAAGIAYFRHAIEFLKTKVLGLPPTEPTPQSAVPVGPAGYTQSLLARFSIPAATWSGSANAGADFYNLLATAVSAATGAAGTLGGGVGTTKRDSLIPSNLQSSGEKMNFITAQRERLNIVLSALDKEAQDLQRTESTKRAAHIHNPRYPSMSFDGNEEEDEPTQRPPSGLSAWSALSKSRSEQDFEKIEAGSDAEDEAMRRRNIAAGGSWMPWGGGWKKAEFGDDPGVSSSVEK